jgi:hypothetical protein
MSEGVAAAWVMIADALQKKEMFSTNNLFARLPEADSQIHFYSIVIFFTKRTLIYFLA